ncbi:T9SS type A sorting domain-containing protein [Crocinitomix catalasitica]|nr:T9SS type A sorting domain-containing protein [Crocinitomix catalasitica]
MKLTLNLLFLFVYSTVYSQPYTEILKSVASDRDTTDRYGYDVDIHGDYAVIGAYGKEQGVENEGAVYVLERTGTNNWVEVQILTNSDQESYDRFGYAVAIFGDLIVVGAYGEDEDEVGANSMSKAGSAYIFERDGAGVWMQVQKIVASDRTVGDEFAWAVAIYDSTIVIGAHLEEEDEVGLNNIYHAGSVYIFDRDGAGVWSESQKIVPIDRAADITFPTGSAGEDLSDLFGGSVAIWNDWMVVGSHMHDYGPGLTAPLWNSGAAYIFERSGGVWTEVAKIQNFDRETWDRFGYDVAIDTNTVIVCSYSEDELEDGVSGSLTNPGSVHIFDRDGAGSWNQVDKIVPLDRNSGDHFGYSLDIHGDRMVLGCHSDNHDESGGAYLEDAGSAYIFEKVAPGDWEQFQKIDASDRAEYDDHGIACAIWEYTVMVGAEYQDFNVVGADSLDEAGAVYIYADSLCSAVTSSQSPTICEGLSVTVGSSVYTTTGTYVDILVKADGCDSTVTTNLTVTPAPTSSQDVGICFGYTFTIGTSAYSTTGTYIDTLTDGSGCDSIVTTNLTVEAENAVTVNVSICWGESYTIGASTYTAAGTYVDVLTSSTFCDSTITTNLTVELPVDVSITQVDNYLTANQGGAIYQWYNCETEMIIAGAVGQSWWAFGIGNYACIINLNGCIDTSACVYVSTIATDEIPLEKLLSIYPNPSEGKFTVQLTQADLGEMDFTILNSLGQAVYQNQLINKIEVDITDLPAGTYHIRLIAESGTVSKKIIID